LKKWHLRVYFALKPQLKKQQRQVPKMAARLKVTQVKSGVGNSQRQRDSLRTLGLKRIGDIIVKDDSLVVRGLVRAVAHLVKVEEIN
jgi:large subunit ribosomal protein L30